MTDDYDCTLPQIKRTDCFGSLAESILAVLSNIHRMGMRPATSPQMLRREPKPCVEFRKRMTLSPKLIHHVNVFPVRQGRIEVSARICQSHTPVRATSLRRCAPPQKIDAGGQSCKPQSKGRKQND